MEKISATVESDCGDTLRNSTLSNSLSDNCCSFDSGLALALSGKFLVVGSSGDESFALLVIDYLNVNLLVAAEDAHTRAFSSSIDMLTDTVMDPSSSFNSR